MFLVNAGQEKQYVVENSSQEGWITFKQLVDWHNSLHNKNNSKEYQRLPKSCLQVTDNDIVYLCYICKTFLDYELIFKEYSEKEIHKNNLNSDASNYYDIENNSKKVVVSDANYGYNYIPLNNGVFQGHFSSVVDYQSNIPSFSNTKTIYTANPVNNILYPVKVTSLKEKSQENLRLALAESKKAFENKFCMNTPTVSTDSHNDCNKKKFLKIYKDCSKKLLYQCQTCLFETHFGPVLKRHQFVSCYGTDNCHKNTHYICNTCGIFVEYALVELHHQKHCSDMTYEYFLKENIKIPKIKAQKKKNSCKTIVPKI